MYTTVRLVSVEGDQPVTREEYPDFYRNFQLGILLAMKEEGFLTEMQCRNAEEDLKRRRLKLMGERGCER